MSIIRAQTTIEHASGIRENFVNNTLYFDVAPGDDVAGNATILGIVQAIKNFYTVAHTVAGAAGGTSLKSHFSTELSVGSNHVFYTKLYRLDDAKPRVPIHDERWASAVAGAGVGMPSEVALVLSFHGAKLSGTVPARRRGRIFLGPIKSSSAAMGANSVVRPATALIESAIGAMIALKTDVDAITGTAAWVVWSQTAQDETVVTNGWVDDSFDTQRKRGAVASAKTLW